MDVAVMLTPEHPQGTLVDPTRPQLLLTDRAATRGDGVFESILLRHGRLRALDAHLERLEASAFALDLLVPPREDWEAALTTALGEFLRGVAGPDGAASAGAPAGVGGGPALPDGAGSAGAPEADGAGPADAVTPPPDVEASIKLVASRGPEGGPGTAWVYVSPVRRSAPATPDDGLRVLLLDRGYDAGATDGAPWLLAGAKTLSYAINLAAQRWAKAHDADDAVFVSHDGQILEGATSSVLVATRDTDGTAVLRSPEPRSGILAGTTQAAAFQAAAAAGWRLGSGPLRREDLLTADAVWLVSSVRLAAPVTLLDGEPVACDAELHRVLTEGLDALL